MRKGLEVEVTNIDTTALALYGGALRTISSNALGLTTVLEAAESALAQAATAWADARAGIKDALAALEALLRDHAGGDEVVGARAELLLGLAGGLGAGGSPAAVKAWLSRTLKEAGIKQLARQVDRALAGANAALGGAAAGAARHAVFRLGDLDGLARCRGAATLGLDPQVIGAATDLAAQLMLACEHAVLAAGTLAGQYRALFGWLLRGLRAIAAEDGIITADAHVESLPSSVVLQAAELVEGPLDADPLGPNLVPGPPCSSGVATLVTELKHRCAQALAGAPDGLRSLVTPDPPTTLLSSYGQSEAASMTCACGDNQGNPGEADSTIKGGETAGVSFAWRWGADSGLDVVGLVQWPHNGGNPRAVLVKLPMGEALHALGFYGSGQLAVLTSPGDSCRRTRLALLPTGDLPCKTLTGAPLSACRLLNRLPERWMWSGSLPSSAAPVLAVSNLARNLAFVGGQRALLFDLL